MQIIYNRLSVFYMNQTPLIKFNAVYIKREDQNPTGSAKDRAIDIQTDNLIEKGISSAVISSTGNAAISALHFCRQKKIKLTIFLSPKVDKKKLEIIKSYKPEIIFSNKPISDAFKFSKKTNAFYLRQSTDPSALIGYQNIGKEILSQLPQVSSIFIPVGSGTTLVGIASSLPSTVKIFAVQPASHAPISSFFDKNFTPETRSVTDALTVKLLPLKPKVITAITGSNGSGLVVQDKEVINAQKELIDGNIFTSPEGALALAGFQKAKQQGLDLGQFPVILFTGANRHE